MTQIGYRASAGCSGREWKSE
eukprot:COSAG01_NODE_32619_length_578_cov_1.083507_1_plen_20_part_10